MTDDGLDGLRRDLLAQRGIDPVAAIGFVHGSTLSEIEASIDKLAQLIGPPTEQEPPGLFDQPPGAKQQRHARLVEMLHNPPPKEHDDQGGTLTRSSFDGGARHTIPAVESHNAWLMRVLRDRKGDAGAGF